jgi:hypothetical protein
MPGYFDPVTATNVISVSKTLPNPHGRSYYHRFLWGDASGGAQEILLLKRNTMISGETGTIDLTSLVDDRAKFAIIQVNIQINPSGVFKWCQVALEETTYDGTPWIKGLSGSNPPASGTTVSLVTELTFDLTNIKTIAWQTDIVGGAPQCWIHLIGEVW